MELYSVLATPRDVTVKGKPFKLTPLALRDLCELGRMIQAAEGLGADGKKAAAPDIHGLRYLLTSDPRFIPLAFWRSASKADATLTQEAVNATLDGVPYTSEWYGIMYWLVTGEEAQGPLASGPSAPPPASGSTGSTP